MARWGSAVAFVVGRLLPLSLQVHSSRLWSVSFLGSIGSVVWEQTTLFSLQ